MRGDAPTGRVVAVGFVGGLAAGLLGVGGGLLMVPGLVLLAGVAQRTAQTASLAAILPIAAVGVAVFAADGEVDYRLALVLGAGGVIGASIAIRALARIPEGVLRALFVAVALVAGARLLLS